MHLEPVHRDLTCSGDKNIVFKMPPSQLKRLKTSLREQGVVGPQKSKKQKKQASKNGSLRDSRIQRTAALQGIREQFNPFEVKAPSRSKYEFASNRTVGGRVQKGMPSRPGVTKSLGEETVRFIPSISTFSDYRLHIAPKDFVS